MRGGISPLRMLSGRVAVITGAGRGIGARAAQMLARHGAAVVVNDMSAEPAHSLAKSIRDGGGKAFAYAGSVTEKAFPAGILQAAATEFGPVDILVNNAGFTWDGMLHRMSDEQWETIADVHVGAPFRMIRAAAPYMRDAGKKEISAGAQPRDRCIVNVSSTSGLHGNVGQANYAAAKMGVVGMTKTVAKEWGAYGVRCNAVAYGFIDTRLTRSAEEQGESMEGLDGKVVLGIPERTRSMLTDPAMLGAMIPLARMGTAEEAAGGIMMLASPWATYVNGHVLEVC